MRFIYNLALALGLIAGGAVNVKAQDCVITVPNDPLTAKGLATPYTQTVCKMADNPSFVQGVILNTDTGALSVFNPIVIDQGTKPAVVLTPPTLPANNVVALWFGTNGATLTLAAAAQNPKAMTSLQAGKCVNGGGNPPTIFGQFAACNAVAFYKAANAAIVAGLLKVPAIGNDFTGKPCPTTRDFGLVDQDPADNVNTQYLITANGQIAQNTPANAAANKGAKVLSNGSDNRLITLLDAAIGCTPWMIPDLADATGKTMTATPATNELQAAAKQGAPVALIPVNDPMVTNNGNTDIKKVNAYKMSADQKPIQNANQASASTFCQNMYSVGAPKILKWMPRTMKAASPDPANTANLAAFLIDRFNAAVGADNLNCVGLLKKPSPLANVMVAGKVTAAFAIFENAPADMVMGDAEVIQMLNLQDLPPIIDAFNANSDPNAPTPGLATADNNGFLSTNVNLISIIIGLGAALVIVLVIFLVRRHMMADTTPKTRSPAISYSGVSAPSQVALYRV